MTTDHRLTITVEDTGCGSTRTPKKVFEKFHRAPSPVQEGSRLGFAITRKLVELQGGTISLESAAGLREPVLCVTASSPSAASRSPLNVHSPVPIIANDYSNGIDVHAQGTLLTS